MKFKVMIISQIHFKEHVPKTTSILYMSLLDVISALYIDPMAAITSRISDWPLLVPMRLESLTLELYTH